MIGLFLILFVSGARKHGQARVFGETGITAGQFAKQKDRAATGFDTAGMDTICA